MRRCKVFLQNYAFRSFNGCPIARKVNKYIEEIFGLSHSWMVRFFCYGS